MSPPDGVPGGITWEPQTPPILQKRQRKIDEWNLHATPHNIGIKGVHPLIPVCAEEPRACPSLFNG